MHQGISRQYYERARLSLLTAPFLMQWLESQCYQFYQNEIEPINMNIQNVANFYFF